MQVKRKGWLEDKTKEIKDVTIKGLEPEIQALVQRHRKEMNDLQERCQEDAKRQLEALSCQQDMYVRCAQWIQVQFPYSGMTGQGRRGTVGHVLGKLQTRNQRQSLQTAS
jgi:hypothetical protein